MATETNKRQIGIFPISRAASADISALINMHVQQQPSHSPLMMDNESYANGTAGEKEGVSGLKNAILTT